MRNLLRSILKKVLRAALLLSFLVLSTSGMNDQADEYSLKAMFIYNFTKYTEWPPSVSREVMQIAVAGYSPIQRSLIEISQHSAAGQQKVRITELDDNAGSYYHVIFIPDSEQDQLESIVKKYQGKGVLIITEDARNASKGAAINLLVSNNKIRFEIFLTNAKNGGIRISSQLINLATKVNP